MRAATWSVGLVSPRSTWESIGALTPERSARSRSERSMASRSARTRGPRGSVPVCTTDIRLYVIAYSPVEGQRLDEPGPPDGDLPTALAYPASPLRGPPLASAPC